MTELQTQADRSDRRNESDDLSEEYLTFILDGEEYGLQILRVQEIKGWDQATTIPNTRVSVETRFRE